MKRRFVIAFVLITLLAAGTTAFPQGVEQQKGFTEFETFQGTINSDNRLLKIDSTVGWDFNKHFGIFGGAPLYFASTPASSTTTGTTTTAFPSSSHTGMGNAYLGMAFRARNSKLNYAGVVTAYAPTGSTANGLNTGRLAVDFTSHFSHSFNRLTPFVEAGGSNTVPDTTFSTRPFTSVGAIGHFEEGSDYRLVKHVYAGASGYQIVPFGSQKIFSRLLSQGGQGSGQGKNIFDNTSQAAGNDLTRENGFNAWVGFEPTPLWRVEIGFTRSMTFDLNSLAFNLRFNVGRMLRLRKS